VEDLFPYEQERITDAIPVSSLDEAREIVERLRR